eukprot:gene9248-10225_t
MADGFAENASKIRESDRQNLMKHILDAVKQCQVRYGGKTELATEKDSCVQCLLAQFENAFLHGLRKGRVWGAINSLSEPLRQVTGKVLSGLPDTESAAFWPFVKEFLVLSEVQRLLSLNHINTDSGRCRAWLRSCLNENSLERMLVAVLSNKSLLRQHYEDWALFNDDERSSTLPVMARGLGFIVFAIEIDSSQLNAQMKQPTFPRANSALAAVEKRNDPLPVISSTGEGKFDVVAGGSKRRRKKKVKQATIEDMEIPEDEPPVGYRLDRNKPDWNKPSTTRSTEDVTSAVDNRIVVNQTDLIKKFSQSHRRATSLESSDFHNEQKKHATAVKEAESAIFEVPDFSHWRAKPVPERRVEVQNKVVSSFDEKMNFEKASEGDRRLEVEEGTEPDLDSANDNNVSSEYMSLMGKLVNLSTSFKTSFSSGILNKKSGKDVGDDKLGQEISQPVLTTANSPSLDKLLDEENDEFTNKSKLEITTNDDNEETVGKIDIAENYESYSNEQASDSSIMRVCSTGTSTVKVAIPRDSLTTNAGLSDNGSIQSCGNSFDRILGQGDFLSPSNSAAVLRMDSALNLNTPPCTPATTTTTAGFDAQNPLGGLQSTDLTSSGLEQRLKELSTADYDCSTGNDDRRVLSSAGLEKKAESSETNVIPDSKQIDENQAETESVNSSYTESVPEDLDVLQPVGYEREKFSDMVMTFDRQSSQAATDALQLLKASTEMHHGYGSTNQQDQWRVSTSNLKQFEYDASEAFTTSPSTIDNDLSTADLKQAILSTIKKKDEVEERNKVLQLAIEEEREYSLTVKTELDNLQAKHQESQGVDLKKIEALSRENEVLRNQLKKYVAAVQLLKRENQNISKETNEAIGTLRGYSEETDIVLPPRPKNRTPSELDSIYEEKLIQMSELHGELMEFHESMQRDLLRKQNQITKMKEELILLRGPLPEDLDNAISDDQSPSHHRQLVNIWIPSVFIKGKGSDAHHLYQVYIRIGDEEWNIYRRYSQFFKMHTACCKEYPNIERFNFPPKKILGKKDLKFVEGRRRKLQEYLRKLINLWITKNEELADAPSKENLENALAFFSDEFNDNGRKKKENSKRKSRNTPIYSGL